MYFFISFKEIDELTTQSKENSYGIRRDIFLARDFRLKEGMRLLTFANSTIISAKALMPLARENRPVHSYTCFLIYYKNFSKLINPFLFQQFQIECCHFLHISFFRIIIHSPFKTFISKRI